MRTRKFSIVLLVIMLVLAFVDLILILGTMSAASDVSYYRDALEAINSAEPSSVSTDIIAGKEPMNNQLGLNKDCYVNEPYSYQDGSEWLVAAKALYDKTHIQLYKLILDAPVGEGTPINSNSDALLYCSDYIDNLPNVDNAIVLYEFHGGEVDGKYISIYDKISYGDNVMQYLSVSDMEMIEYVINNSYDLFPDYNTRTIRTWELIGNNIADGYDRNLYGTANQYSTEWDRNYYQESMNASAIAAVILGLLSVGITAGIMVLFYLNFVLHPRAYRAEIEAQEAEAARQILEAPVERLRDESDDLVDKYLN